MGGEPGSSLELPDNNPISLAEDRWGAMPVAYHRCCSRNVHQETVTRRWLPINLRDTYILTSIPHIDLATRKWGVPRPTAFYPWLHIASGSYSAPVKRRLPHTFYLRSWKLRGQEDANNTPGGIGMTDDWRLGHPNGANGHLSIVSVSPRLVGIPYLVCCILIYNSPAITVT